MATRFTTPYNYDRAISARFATVNNEPSLTQQSDAAELDINVIMAKYSQTGMLPQRIEPGQYGDFSDVVDYRQSIERIQEANEAFQGIPAKIRADFNNDPGAFFAFANDPGNIEKLREYGLAEKTPPAHNPPVNIPPPTPEVDNGVPIPAAAVSSTPVPPARGPSGPPGGR